MTKADSAPERFGQRITKRREELGLTLQELADLTHSTKSYMWELENKPAIRPGALKVWRLSQALELPYEFLILGRMPINSGETEIVAAYRKLDTTADRNAALRMIRGLSK